MKLTVSWLKSANRFTKKEKLSILGLFAVYKNNFLLNLVGVESDFDNLSDFLEKTNINFDYLLEPNREQILSCIKHKYFNVLWICGHGLPGGNFITPTKTIFPGVVHTLSGKILAGSLFECESTPPFLFCVFDFCFGSESVPAFLPFKYQNGSFHIKNLENTNTELTKQMVYVSACGYIPEDVNGGFLTQYVLYLLKKYGYLSLDLLDGDREETFREKFSIDSNKLIEKDFKFIEI